MKTSKPSKDGQSLLTVRINKRCEDRIKGGEVTNKKQMKIRPDAEESAVRKKQLELLNYPTLNVSVCA